MKISIVTIGLTLAFICAIILNIVVSFIADKYATNKQKYANPDELNFLDKMITVYLCHKRLLLSSSLITGAVAVSSLMLAVPATQMLSSKLKLTTN